LRKEGKGLRKRKKGKIADALHKKRIVNLLRSKRSKKGNAALRVFQGGSAGKRKRRKGGRGNTLQILQGNSVPRKKGKNECGGKRKVAVTRKEGKKKGRSINSSVEEKKTRGEEKKDSRCFFRPGKEKEGGGGKGEFLISPGKGESPGKKTFRPRGVEAPRKKEGKTLLGKERKDARSA